MHKLKKMTELVEAIPDSKEKTAMKLLLGSVELLDNAQADYEGLSNVEREGLPKSIRHFFGDYTNTNGLDDFDADIPFD